MVATAGLASTVCICPDGQYKTASNTCSQCTSGQTTSVVGSTASSQCKSRVGTTLPAGISIVSKKFYVNGVITNNGAISTSKKRGLLINSRMIQGVFDYDGSNSGNSYLYYADTGVWDPT